MFRFLKSLTVGFCLASSVCSILVPVLAQQAETPKAASDFPSKSFFHTSSGNFSGGEREWTLNNGLKLIGIPYVNGLGDVGIQRQGGEHPSNVTVPISEFSKQDQETILADLPKVLDPHRKYSIYQGVEVEPKWAKAQPEFPELLRKAIHADKMYVYFLTWNSLILVEKSAFTSESLAQILEAIERVRHQVVLFDDRYSFNAIGVPLQMTKQGLVLEVKEPKTEGALKLARGLRYLVPRRSLQAPWDELTMQIAAEVQAEGSFTMPTEAEIHQLQRICSTTRGNLLIRARSDSPSTEVLVGSDGDKAVVMQPHELRCRDYVSWAGFDLGGTTGIGTTSNRIEFPAEILTTLVDGVAMRDFWSQKKGRTFRGKLLGMFADGFIFQMSGTNKFFVPAAQLDEVDAVVASAAMSEVADPFQWYEPERDDLKSILSRRVDFLGDVVEMTGAPTRVNSALETEVPEAFYAASRNQRYVYSRLHEILIARDVHHWMDENADLLSSGTSKEVLQRLAAKYPINVGSVPAKLLPNRQKIHWQLADANGEFEAVLVGSHEGDFVFETTVNGQARTFLVDPGALEASAKAKADTLAKRLDGKAWTGSLTRHENWQNYRIGYDPTGKVRFPPMPVVVLSVSDSLVRFESLEGHQFSQPLPQAPAQQQATIAAFKGALEQGQKLRKAAESHLSLWSFQDAEPTVQAELIGVSDNFILVRDVNQTEFLISRATLSAKSQSMLEAALPSTRNLRRLQPSDEWELPRVWCLRTEILGPAIPEFLIDKLKQLVIRHTNGEQQVFPLDELMLRDQLSTLAAWRLRHPELAPREDLPRADSQKTVDTWLSAPVPEADRLTTAPALDQEIERRIRTAFEAWQNTVWPASPIRLPKNSKLLAVNANATAGVIENESGWHAVDFETGQTQLVRKVNHSDSIQFGPWMEADTKAVYWVASGKIQSARPNEPVATVETGEQAPIIAACQSGDFQSLVVFLADDSIRRIDLGNYQIELVVSPDKVGALQADTASVWASNDGRSALLVRGTANQLFVSPRGKKPELSALFFPNQSPLAVAVGTDCAWMGWEVTPRSLYCLFGSTTNLPPSTYGIPCAAQWMGEVEIDGRNVFQSIGRFEDDRSRQNDRFFVTYRGSKGFFEEYATQFVEGQIDERAKMAANGAALVHWRGEQAVVSRRPNKLPRSPELVIIELVKELIAKRDIGQLEAISLLLHKAPYDGLGPHQGWWSLNFQSIVDTACLFYQEHLEGDCFGRAISLAKSFQRQFPNSQVAVNVLANLERKLAWDARGTGFADSVTPAGIAAFKAHMRKAKKLLEPFLEGEPSAPTLQSAIDVAMGLGDVQLAKRVADILAKSSHAKNSKLHHSLCFLLLPRWHGKPGSSEAYRDSVVDKLSVNEGNILYAQLVLDMFDVHGLERPLSQLMNVDLNKVALGVEAYYKSYTHPDLIDRAILFVAFERDLELCKRLVKLKVEKQLLPSFTVTRHAADFRVIERELGK